jgi:hypothetical protein
MRPAGRQRNAVATTTPIRTLSESLSRLTADDDDEETVTFAKAADTELSEAAETEVILAPAAFAEAHAAAAALERAERHLRLADDIRQRIHKRLPGRIHDLVVRLNGNTVVLEGRCATYYSKQLAQTAALGALEDEHLENSIVVIM